MFDDIGLGASIACNGICLTVVRYDTSSFDVEVMNETQSKTNTTSWRPGSLINLERALKLGQRLDGHWVQGHVDTALPLYKKELKGETLYLWFRYPHSDKHLLVAQGSIALNGVSLTIAELNENSLAVALISHTLQNSNLSALITGDLVNVEYDILGKYIAVLNGGQHTGITEKWLYEKGF